MAGNEKIIVDVGFKEDSSVGDVISHLQTIKNTMGDLSSDQGSTQFTGVLETLGLSGSNLQDFSNIIQSTITSLESIGTNMTTIPGYFRNSFGSLKSEITEIEKLFNNINKHQQTIGTDASKDLGKAQQLMMSMAAISSQQKMIQNTQGIMTGASNVNLGWDASTFAKYAPHIATMQVEPLLRQMIASSKHGLSFQGMVNGLLANSSYTGNIKHLLKQEGFDIKTDQINDIIRNNTVAILQGYTKQAAGAETSKLLGQWMGSGKLQTMQAPLSPQQRLSSQYDIDAFNNYGRHEGTMQAAAEYIRRNHNVQRSFATSKEARTRSGLEDFYSFLGQGNNVMELLPLLREAGIGEDSRESGNKGVFRAYESLHEQQLQFLKARLLQEYKNAIDSDAVYEKDSSNAFFASSTARRQGKNASMYLDAINTLNGVIPSINAMQPGQMKGEGTLRRTNIALGAAPSPDRYFIPNTTIDFKTGQAAVRDLNWRKQGIEQSKDDELIAVTDSMGARMFGFQGDRTVGLGRDKETGKIIREGALPWITADFSSLLKQDEEGRYVVDRDNPNYSMAKDILGRKRDIEYDGRKYRYLAQHDDGRVVFGLADTMKTLESAYVERGLPSPFQYGMDRKGGIHFQGDPAQTVKNIEYLSKMLSSGSLIEDLYPDSSVNLKDAKGAYVNFEMMYDILGMDKDRRMDGLVYGDPRYFFKDMQARYGLGTAKFMLTAQDWRPILKQSFGKSAAANPRLFQKTLDQNGKEQFHVYAPTGGANEEDRKYIEEYITGKRKLEDGTYEDITDAGYLENLRNNYFVDLMANDIAFVMDRTAVKPATGYRTLSATNYAKRAAFDKRYDLEQAKREGRYNKETGEVRLLPWQQMDVLSDYSKAWNKDRKYSGFIEMRDEDNMQSAKEYMPESVLRALGAPPEVFEESERRYRQKIDELNTTAGRMKQFANDRNAQEKMKADPRWIWDSQEANTHIEQTRRALEYHRAVHDILMPEERESTVAVGTVGQLAELYQGFTKLNDKDYGKFASMLPHVMEKNNAIWSNGISSESIDMLGRFPFASGQYLMDVKNYAKAAEVDQYLNDVENLEKTKAGLKTYESRENVKPETLERIRKRRDDLQARVDQWNKQIKDNPESALAFAAGLRESGRDPRSINSSVMSAFQIYTMNTGDFDGDTVNAFIRLGELAETREKFKANAVKNKAEFDAYRAKAGVETSTAPSTLEDRELGDISLQAMAQSNNATNAMAQASAALRKAQTADATESDRIAAIVEAMQAYDRATSNVKKKGETFQMGGYAYKYLSSQGQHYERFIRSLHKARNDKDRDAPDIFGVSAASLTDPEGVFAMAARKTDLEKNGIMDMSSLELMENWYDKQYGTSDTYEAKAARFYLDKMEDNLIWSKLWTDEDVVQADNLRKQWESDLRARSVAPGAVSVKIQDEENRLNSFKKRIDELNSGKFGTVSAVRDYAQRYRMMAADNPQNAAMYNKYADYLENLLPSATPTEADKVRDSIIGGTAFERAAKAKAIRVAAASNTDIEEQKLMEERIRAGLIMDSVEGKSGKTIYNWSSAKHYRGPTTGNATVALPKYEHYDLGSAFDAQGNIIPTQAQAIAGGTVNYGRTGADLAEFEKDLILTITGRDQETGANRNVWTHIGNIMHKAFENVHDPNMQTSVSDAIAVMRKQFLDPGLSNDTDRFDARALRDLGLVFREGDDGSIIVKGDDRYSSHQITGIQSHINGMLNSSFENINRYIAAGEKNGERLYSQESDLFNEKGEIIDRDYGGGIYRRVVMDKEGNVIHGKSRTSLENNFDNSDVNTEAGEYAHVFTTHAKPDYVAQMANKMMHIYDYKSSGSGSLQSLPQSAFYGALFAELGKAYYESGDTDETRDQRYRKYKDWVRKDASGQYVANIGRITGLSPKGSGGVDTMDLTTPEGQTWLNQQLQDMDVAFARQYQRGLEGFQAGQTLLNSIDAQRSAKTAASAQAIFRANANDENADKDLLAQRQRIQSGSDLFLATYGQNKQRLKELESDIYKEYNRNNINANDYIPDDRFSRRRSELLQMFNVEEQAAMLLKYQGDPGAEKEIEDITRRRDRALSLNNETAFKAAITDVDDAMVKVRRDLNGINPSTQTQSILNAYRRFDAAANTREYLKEDEAYYDKNKGFKINDADEAIRTEAIKRRDQYQAAVETEEKNREELNKEVDAYVSRYSDSEQKKIASITAAKPEDPTKVLTNFIDKKREDLQKMVDQYNENVREYEADLMKTTDPEKIKNLRALQAQDKQSAETLQEYINSSAFKSKTIEEEKERLGLVQKTPEEKAHEWAATRRAVLDAEANNIKANGQFLLNEGRVDEYWSGKERLSQIENEKALIDQQASQMQKREENAQKTEYDAFTRNAYGQQLTRDQFVEMRKTELQERAQRMRDRYGVGSEMYNKWNDLISNEPFWNDYGKRMEDEYNTNEAVRQMQREHQLAATDRQVAIRRSNFDYSQAAFDRHRRQSLLGYSMFGRNYGSYIDRRESLTQQNKSRENEVAGLRERNKEINERLKTEQDPNKRSDYETQLAANRKRISEANREIGKTQQEINSLSGGGALLSATFDTAGQAISRLAQRLGRQLFQKALQETKRFVNEFNKSMTTIQMITLKSDSEMSTLGDGLIAKAKELKISISEITQMSTDLYRQGLSDEEMGERLDVIAKFSKVSGTKAGDATKLITTAMNTGLVSSAQEAADIVTILGDSAATNAAQIEKGIEKAGAAAAVDGTSFGQLAALLTAVTATTQVTGNVAGTTLNSIFGRMNKVGMNDLIYDENGKAMSGSDIATLLRANGVDYQDANGNKRSTFDILKDLSVKYESMDDLSQKQIATAISGTRQYSNFSAIMTAFREGEMDRYMGLLGESEGVTDKKYDIYTKSFEASMTNLRNTFDKAVADLSEKGILTDFIDNIAKAIQGVNNLANAFKGLGGSAGGIVGALTPVVAILAGIGMLKAGIMSANIGLVIGGVALAGVSYGIAAAIGNNNNQSATEAYKEQKEKTDEFTNSWDSKIAKARSLNKKENRTESEQKELDSLTRELSTYAKMGGVNIDSTGIEASAESATGALNNLSSAIDGVKGSADNTTNVINAAEEANNKQKARDIYTSTDSQAAAMFEEYDKQSSSYAESAAAAISTLEGKMFERDENGELRLKDNVEENYSRLSQEEKRAFARSIFEPSGLYQGAAREEITDRMNAANWDPSEAGLRLSYDASNTLKEFDFARDEEGSILQQYETFMRAADKGMAYESTDSYNRSVAKDLFSKYFAGSVSSDMLPYLAEQATRELYNSVTDKDGNVRDITRDDFLNVINGLYGLDNTENDARFTWDSMQASLKASAEKAGYGKKAEWLEQLDLEDAGVGGFYIDEKGERISAEEAERRVKEYNEQDKLETREFELVNAEDNKQTFGKYNWREYGTTEEAEKVANQAKDQGIYYYVDQNGNVHDRDENGNLFTTAEARDAARTASDSSQKLWQSTFYNPNTKTWYRTILGTEAEARNDERLIQLRNKIASRAFGLKTTNGEELIGDEYRYGSFAEAHDAAVEYNRVAQQRYEDALQAASEEQQANTSASYENARGETVVRYGPRAHQEIAQLRAEEMKNSPWIILDSNGDYLSSAKSEEEARQKYMDNYVHYTDQFGNDFGTGEQARLAYEQAKKEWEANIENYDYYVGDKVVGRGQKGKDLAESMATSYDIGTGEVFYNPQEADQALENANLLMEENARQIMLQQPHLSWDDAMSIAKQEAGWTNLTEGVNITHGEVGRKLKQELQFIPQDIDPFDIRPIEDIISGITDVVPELANVDPPTVLRVFGQLPTAIQTALTKASETGEYSLELIEATNKALAEVKMPELKTVKNHFQAGVTNFNSQWKTDNAYKTTADEMLRMIQSNGITDVQSLFDYVNLNDISQWSVLNQNADFAHLLSQYRFDETGMQVGGPKSIDDIITFLYQNGRDYGQEVLTSDERGRRAQNAYDRFASGHFVSQEAARERAEVEYEQEVADAKALFKAGAGKDLSEEEFNKQFNEILKREGIGSLEDYQSKYINDALSENDWGYIEGVLGKDLTQKLKTSGVKGLTTEENTLASTLLRNSTYGLNGLTAADRLAGIRDIRARAQTNSLTGYSETAAAQYMSGWSDWNTYFALQKKFEDKTITEDEQKMLDALNVSLANVEKNAEIEFKVQGLSDLEQAGELLEGTANLIKQIQKGGTFKIKAEMEILNNASNRIQSEALLQSGSTAEQVEQIRALTGLDDLYIQRNFAESKGMAERVIESQRSQVAGQYAQVLSNYTEGSSEATDLINIAANEGYELYKDKDGNNAFRYVGRKGPLSQYYADTLASYAEGSKESTELIALAAEQGYELYKDANGNNAFRYIGPAEPLRGNAFFGKERQYTDLELAQARAEIMAGTLTHESGDYERYSAAASSGGRYFNAYQTLLADEKSTPEERERYRQLAENEEALTRRQVRDADRLERFRLNSGTLRGMSAYAQEQYRQNNRSGLAANSVFESLATVQNAEDLVKVMGDEKNKNNFKDLIEASPDLAKKLADLGLSVGDNNEWDVSSLVDSTGNLTGAFGELIAAVAGASEAYNKYAAVDTVGEQYEKAQRYLSGDFQPGEEDQLFTAFSGFIGDQNLAQAQRSAIGLHNAWVESNPLPEGFSYRAAVYGEDGQVLSPSRIYNNNGVELTNPSLISQYEDYLAAEPSTTVQLTGLNQKYWDDRMYNGSVGRDGLSMYQQYDALSLMVDAMRKGGYDAVSNPTGGLTGMYNATYSGVWDNYLSGMSTDTVDFQKFMPMAMEFEKQGLNIMDIGDYVQGSAEFERAIDIVKQFDTNIQDVKENVDNMGTALDVLSAQALNSFNEETDEATKRMEAYAKGGKDAARQAAADAKAIKDLSNQMYAAGNIKGKSGKQITKKKDLEQIQAYLGLPDTKSVKDYLKDKSKEWMDAFSDTMASDTNKQFTNSMVKPALDKLLTDAQAAIDAGDLTVEPVIEVLWQLKEGNVGAAMDLAAQIGSEAYDMLAPLEGVIASLDIDIDKYFDSEGGKIDIIGILSEVMATMKKPSGYSGGGGGGGGGGESEAQKMLKRHKHEINEAQHHVKMEEIRQSHYDFINDYDMYIESLGKEEQAYANLEAIYQRQIQEMEGMMGSLEAYSDDWWGVKEALDAAKESLADVQNKLDAIETKRVDIIIQKQENEDKPTAQKQALWSEKARGYQIRDQFESYAVSETKRIEEIEQQRKDNEAQRAELEKTLWETTEGSDAWLKARDQIWENQKESAALANDIEEAYRALDLATVQQMQTDLTNRLSPREHVDSMLDQYGQLYNTNRQYDNYRNTMTQRMGFNQERYDLYQASRDQIAAEMQKIEDEGRKGSEAWYAARDALNSFDEAMLQIIVTNDELQRSFEQSMVDELVKKYTDVNDAYSHTMNLLKTQQDRYDKNDNFTMYIQTVTAQSEEATAHMAELEEQLTGYIELSKDLHKDTEAWDENQKNIRSTEEAIESLRNQIEELDRLSNQSEFQHIQELFNRQDNLDEHQLKMIQFQETRYQNRGELTNYGKMLEFDSNVRQERIKHLDEYIEKLQKRLEKEKEGTDEYYKVVDAIYKAEEQRESETIGIEKNTEALEKNREAILKTHKALVDTIDTEIKTRIREEREQLAARVSMENSILNLIRKRYQEEAKLIREDVNNKKRALQEEKALINERLQARLQAEQEEERYRELSELQRQLTLIVSDPTRTRDAKEIQKKIDDLQKQNADEIAKQEAQAAQERIDDQIKAMEESTAYNEAKLNEMLKDANSPLLHEELNAVIGDESMTREERIANYLDWIRQNDENYKFGTEAMRMQMEQTAEDNWNKMLGFVETYWDQVHEIIDGGIESVLSYMKDSTAYQNAENESAQKLLEINWRNLFEAWEDANKDDAEYSHEHDNIVLEVEDEVHDINMGIKDIYGLERDLYDLFTGAVENDYIRPTDVDPDADNNDYRDYAGVGRTARAIGTDTGSGGGGGGSGGSGSGGGRSSRRKPEDNTPTISTHTHTYDYVLDDAGGYTTVHYTDRGNELSGRYATRREAVAAAENALALNARGDDWLRRNVITGPNAEGGLINYTGLAWVDGTMEKPESFLDAVDTENIRRLTDALNYITVSPFTSVSPDLFNSNNTQTIGDINIIINQADLSTDADLDYLAQQVGRKFTRQLEKQGLNLAGYQW